MAKESAEFHLTLNGANSTAQTYIILNIKLNLLEYHSCMATKTVNEIIHERL